MVTFAFKCILLRMPVNDRPRIYLIMQRQETTTKPSKKQQILNYQIKLIQQCTDSLFNEVNCCHDRYLSWQLYDTLRAMLKDYRYNLRWIGNGDQSYIYAYCYVLIVGCAAAAPLMIELKAVLYELAEKYLAQYEQKLLVEFLCLIEYSRDRYMFFRKYPKVQSLLIKIFKQIQERSALHQSQIPKEMQVCIDVLPSIQQSIASVANQGHSSHLPSSASKHDISKNTTCITSPSRSKVKIHVEDASLRNSDYYNSLKKIDQRSSLRRTLNGNSSGLGHLNGVSSQRLRCFKWYQVYNKFFSFVNMANINESNLKFVIDQLATQKMKTNTTKSSDGLEFIISVEKGCFFVVELMLIHSQELNRKISELDSSKQMQKSASVTAFSQDYLAQLLQKEIRQNLGEDESILNSLKKCENSSKRKDIFYTPKFITNKKKLSINSNLYAEEDDGNKICNVEVLNIEQFYQDEQEKKDLQSATGKRGLRARQQKKYVTEQTIQSEQHQNVKQYQITQYLQQKKQKFKEMKKQYESIGQSIANQVQTTNKNQKPEITSHSQHKIKKNYVGKGQTSMKFIPSKKKFNKIEPSEKVSGDEIQKTKSNRLQIQKTIVNLSANSSNTNTDNFSKNSSYRSIKLNQNLRKSPNNFNQQKSFANLPQSISNYHQNINTANLSNPQSKLVFNPFIKFRQIKEISTVTSPKIKFTYN